MSGFDRGQNWIMWPVSISQVGHRWRWSGGTESSHALLQTGKDSPSGSGRMVLGLEDRPDGLLDHLRGVRVHLGGVGSRRARACEFA